MELANQHGGEGGATPDRHTELQQMLAQRQVRLLCAFTLPAGCRRASDYCALQISPSEYDVLVTRMDTEQALTPAADLEQQRAWRQGHAVRSPSPDPASSPQHRLQHVSDCLHPATHEGSVSAASPDAGFFASDFAAGCGIMQDTTVVSQRDNVSPDAGFFAAGFASDCEILQDAKQIPGVVKGRSPIFETVVSPRDNVAADAGFFAADFGPRCQIMQDTERITSKITDYVEAAQNVELTVELAWDEEARARSQLVQQLESVRGLAANLLRAEARGCEDAPFSGARLQPQPSRQ